MHGIAGICRADFNCGQLPVVRWHPRHSTNPVDVCQSHLDMWLDIADDNENIEPVKLIRLSDGAVMSWA